MDKQTERVATAEMIEAGAESLRLNDIRSSSYKTDAGECWQAMWDAAPLPEPLPEGELEGEARELLAWLRAWPGVEDDALSAGVVAREMQRAANLIAALASRLTPQPVGEDEAQAIIEQLRKAARSVSEVQRGMAQAKSLRQGDHNPPRDDLYMWPTPEQTLEWRAADMLAALLRSSQTAKVEAYREAIGAVDTVDLKGPLCVGWPDGAAAARRMIRAAILALADQQAKP